MLFLVLCGYFSKISRSATKAIREKEHVSQTVFAHYLNVSKNMISEWERGVKNQPERR
ncbi:helix-turn-helix domain-containing protein [Aggregatibacter actinomycetemcomitans]|uniref:helix-turn-helix domain-containing protein n=1 Tax=Aggregatibacter actinomycetemcomitans TaxID=714 RepID=UPI001C5568F8|nr:helix-turn-helix domain-containing protein [Aggregatibacter actinomycetemcomitans]